jgi:hypothetical protein
MRNFKDENGQLWGIGEAQDTDGDQSFLIEDGWVELTDEEAEAMRNPPETPEKLQEEKWVLVDNFKKSLTVTTQSNNKFAANPSALLNIGFKVLNPIPQDTIAWFEDWGTFTTSTVELQEVLNEADRLTQEFINLIFGEVL